ncbi:hypothetical protein EsH8_XIII_000041 [Colletotrichum jinshuiense]
MPAGVVLLVPLHHASEHWSTARIIISKSEVVFEHYDSLPKLQCFDSVRATAEPWLKQIFPGKIVKVLSKECPLQSDDVSCGVFTLACIQHHLEETLLPQSIDPTKQRAEFLALFQRFEIPAKVEMPAKSTFSSYLWDVVRHIRKETHVISHEDNSDPADQQSSPYANPGTAEADIISLEKQQKQATVPQEEQEMEPRWEFPSNYNYDDDAGAESALTSGSVKRKRGDMCDDSPPAGQIKEHQDSGNSEEGQVNFNTQKHNLISWIRENTPAETRQKLSVARAKSKELKRTKSETQLRLKCLEDLRVRREARAAQLRAAFADVGNSLLQKKRDTREGSDEKSLVREQEEEDAVQYEKYVSMIMETAGMMARQYGDPVQGTDTILKQRSELETSLGDIQAQSQQVDQELGVLESELEKRQSAFNEIYQAMKTADERGTVESQGSGCK